MNIKEYLTGKLNDAQRDAVLYTDTSALINAGAGSGKTRVLTHKIAYLFWGKNVPVDRVLAVTFTNKAANEMKERLITLGDEMCDMDFDDGTMPFHLKNRQLKWVGTFHSTFLKILKEDIDKLGLKYKGNFGILDSDDQKKLLKDLLKKYTLEGVYKPQDVKKYISSQKRLGLLPREVVASDKDEELRLQIYLEYQKELEKSNSLDFDDILLLAHRLFREDKNVLRKRQDMFDYILVDETQDTNTVQFELLNMLTGTGANITLVGDDYQSIYRFTGANMKNFLSLERYWPDIKVFKLEINYRSKPFIVRAGNLLIKQNEERLDKDVRANRDGGEKDIIKVFNHRTGEDEANNIVDFIKKMKDAGKFKEWRQIAILYRTNAQSQLFESKFIQEGIPYKIYGAFKFFERKEVKDILAYLRFINNPFDNISVKRIANIPNRKLGDTSLGHIEEYADKKGISLFEAFLEISLIVDNKRIENELGFKLVPAAVQGVIDFMKLFEELKQFVSNSNPRELIEEILRKINYRGYLLKEEDSEEAANDKYENIGQLINMASKYEIGMISLDQVKLENGDDLLRLFLEEVTLMVDAIESEDGDVDAVRLMTVHTSKGLEFPCVFIVGLEDGLFPTSGAAMSKDDLEEERRLMYVAITRAKDILFFSYAESRMRRGQTELCVPSRFIGELEFANDESNKYSEDKSKLLDYVDFTKMTQLAAPEISVGDRVKFSFFGEGSVIEVNDEYATVMFDKRGLKNIEKYHLKKL